MGFDFGAILAWFTPVADFCLYKLVPNLVIALVGWLVIKLFVKLVQKTLRKSKLERAAHTLILAAVRTVLYILLALIVASGLGIDVTGVVALASVLTLAVSLALQNMLANVIGGFSLLYTKPFVSDDYVDVAGQSGTVQEIGLTYTKLVTPDNKIVSIPNSAVVAAQIVNYTVTGTRRLDVDLAVSYNTPVEKMMDVLRLAAVQPQVITTPAPVVAVKSYSETCINYTLRVWCNQEAYWDLNFAINETISNLCKQHGIAIYDPKMKIQLENK